MALALLERLEDERFLLRAHAAQGANASVRGAARSRSSSVRMPSSRYSVATVFGPDALQVEQIENGRRELGEQLAMKGSVAGFGDLADSAARSLPMPGISRSRSRRARRAACGWLATMSAPLRYARILKGLSFLISRRSAIFAKDARDREVIQAGGLPSRCDSRARARRRLARASAMRSRAAGGP